MRIEQVVPAKFKLDTISEKAQNGERKRKKGVIRTPLSSLKLQLNHWYIYIFRFCLFWSLVFYLSMWTFCVIKSDIICYSLGARKQRKHRNMNTKKTACFIGDRGMKMPQNSEKVSKLQVAVYEEIDKAVNDGYNNFIFGACCGFDLMCAEMVLLRQRLLKQIDKKQIYLTAALSFNDSIRTWSEQQQKQYTKILVQCDHVWVRTRRS